MSHVFAHEEVAILIVLRQLIDDGRFQEAKDMAASLDETNSFSNNGADYARFLSLKGTIYYHLADYTQSLALAKQALELVKGTDDNSLIAELQSIVARSYTETGKITEAERGYRDLISTYRRLDHTAGILRSLNRLSRIFFIRSQFDKAAECLIEAADHARGIDDQKWEAMIQGNLGTIFNLTGEFTKSVEFLEKSVTLNRTLANELNLCRAYLSLGYAQMHLKNFRTAEQNLDQAESIIKSSGFDPEAITLKQYRALIALFTGDPVTARELAQDVLDRVSADAETNATICQAGRIIAEAEIQLENFQAANKAVRPALEAARKLGEKVEIGACLRIMAQIMNHLGSTESAEEYFSDAVNYLTESGARFDVAMTYLVWSRLTPSHHLRTEHRGEASRILSALRLEDIYLKKTSSKPRSEPKEALLVGESPEFTALIELAEICAESDISVLLLGETGSGKDQFAKYIHSHSHRAKSAFIQVNCAAIPLELAESELFGYEKGAFTNASDSKIGLLEAADGGTLFLNEIGELPLRLQAKLLAALEEKKFLKLGGTTPRKVNFRLIAATNVELSEAVHQGKFRADLFYRLAVMTLQMPRLAARGTDSYQLLRHFLGLEQIDLEDISPRILEKLSASCQSYDWPGNVRELKNYVELFTLTEQRDPQAICLKLIARLQSRAVPLHEEREPEPVSLTQEVEQFERSRIDAALDGCGGVIRRAASYLGLPEATLRSKLKKYRISAA